MGHELHSSFYYSYDNVISDMDERDVDAYSRDGWTEEGVKYSELERLIVGNCRKLAKALARETHHTEAEWRDTIVVLLMTQLLPGFECHPANDDVTQHG